MKVRSAIKRICGFCQIVRRGKTLYVRCQKYGRHKQRQGFHSTERRLVLGDKNFCECPSLNIIKKKEVKCCDKDHNHDQVDDLIEQFSNKLI